MTPWWSRAKQAAALTAVLIIAGAILFGTSRLLGWLFPRHDPVPIETARKDELKGAAVAQGIGAATAGQNRDSTVHVDITTKEIRDAFDAPPLAPPAGQPAPAIPAAPVERVHDALNEGIARANRAADAAAAAR